MKVGTASEWLLTANRSGVPIAPPAVLASLPENVRRVHQSHSASSPCLPGVQCEPVGATWPNPDDATRGPIASLMSPDEPPGPWVVAFSPSYLPTLLTFPPSYPPTFLRSYLPTFLPSYLLTFPPSHLPTFLPSCLPTFLPSYLLAGGDAPQVKFTFSTLPMRPFTGGHTWFNQNVPRTASLPHLAAHPSFTPLIHSLTARSFSVPPIY